MRKFLLKLLLLTVVVAGIQICLPVSQDIPNEIKLLDFFMKRQADIVYFGDSTINWAAPNDGNQASMPDLLNRLLPQRRVAKITHASYQPDVYASYADYIARKGYEPRVVIIPINLRSFSPEWDIQPLWQFEKEKLTLAIKDTFWMRFYRPLSIFKFFEPRINRFEYEQTKVYDGKLLVGRVRDFDNANFKTATQENFKNKIIFRYMTPVSKDHRKVKSLVKTAKTLQSRGIKTVFYLTPLDWNVIVKSVGPEALVQLSQNVNVIKDALARSGFSVLDLSLTLPSEEFCWQDAEDGPRYPNEHLRLRGRMFVARALADQLTPAEK